MAEDEIPGIFVESLKGTHSYERRMLRDRMNRDGTSDLHDPDDGQWMGEMGDIHLRTLRILVAAFELGVLAASLDRVHRDGESTLVNENRDMFDFWAKARREAVKAEQTLVKDADRVREEAAQPLTPAEQDEFAHGLGEIDGSGA